MAAVPWWGNIGAKLVLSRIPLGYKAWASLGAFRHGANHDAEYAADIFLKHYRLAAPAKGFACLELGPGDAVSSAVLARSFGAAETWQVDVAPFATRDIEVYRRVAAHAHALGGAEIDLSQVRTFDEMLGALGARYRHQGLASLRQMPTDSIDFIYSQSCLEHVRLDELAETLVETRRVLKPGGKASHWVDLRDHLGFSLHNLRFSRRVWESPFMAEAGFYTNRVRYSQFLQLFRDAGFEIEVTGLAEWPQPPLARRLLDPEFRDLDELDLKVKGFGVICR